MRCPALLFLAAALSAMPVSAQQQSDPPPVFSLPGAPRPASESDSSARVTEAPERPAPRFTVGGKEMVLPGPSRDFEEVGDRLRTTFFELLTHPSDRLVAAYLSSQTLADLTAGKNTGSLGLYGMVQAPRLQEYADCTPADFQEVLAGLKQVMGQTDNATLVEQMQGAMSNQLNTMGFKSVSLEGFKPLGLAFQKPDAAGYLMRQVVQQENRKIPMITGISALRVKNRLLLVCLFRKNESPETVKSMRDDFEKWADRILAANE
jgi:hypothetical protein